MMRANRPTCWCLDLLNSQDIPTTKQLTKNGTKWKSFSCKILKRSLCLLCPLISFPRGHLGNRNSRSFKIETSIVKFVVLRQLYLLHVLWLSTLWFRRYLPGWQIMVYMILWVYDIIYTIRWGTYIYINKYKYKYIYTYAVYINLTYQLLHGLLSLLLGSLPRLISTS